MDRYCVEEGSNSGHCCFTHTVVDSENDGESLCECFEEADAVKIADALNRASANAGTTKQEEGT